MKNHTTKSTSLSPTLLICLGLALLAGSCSANQADAVGDTKSKLSAAPIQPTVVPMPATRTQIPISEMKKMNKQEQTIFAKEDLAKRLDLEIAEVTLSGATPVMWRSGALGCPQPGMQYTQALVKGLLIMLRVGNTAYRYHGIPAGEPFYCPDSQAEAPYINSSDT